MSIFGKSDEEVAREVAEARRVQEAREKMALEARIKHLEDAEAALSRAIDTYPQGRGKVNNRSYASRSEVSAALNEAYAQLARKTRGSEPT